MGPESHTRSSGLCEHPFARKPRSAIQLPSILVVWLLGTLGTGCGLPTYSYREPTYDRIVVRGTVLRHLSLDRHREDAILALDPERMSEDDVRTLLGAGPAPRILNVHGAVYPVELIMESFSQFLIGMGYPEGKIRHPKDGRFSHSPYESSRKLAGLIAWYYEKEGMRPMLVGHSLGGIQVVKILHELAGAFNDSIPVWNPLTDEPEDRDFVIDPLTGEGRPVVGFRVGYASAMGAGPLALLLPNQWILLGRLRTIPNTVEDFTGFTIGLDLFTWDFPGFSLAGSYHPSGTARVRNVTLPIGYSHVMVPVTSHLATERKVREWINAYVPGQPVDLSALSDVSSMNILWAADVWYSIKKHWCLELQRLVRAKRSLIRWE